MKNLMLFGKVFITLWLIVTLLYVKGVDGQTCNSLCSFPHRCQADSGKCLCSVGWTGPNAFYTEIGGNRRVLADYCIQACFYNNDFKNSACADDPPPTTTTTTTTTPTTTTTTTTPTTTTTTPTTTTATPTTTTTTPTTTTATPTTTTTTPTTTTPTTTTTTTTTPTTTTSTTTRSPSDILYELCAKFRMAQSLLDQLKQIYPVDPPVYSTTTAPANNYTMPASNYTMQTNNYTMPANNYTMPDREQMEIQN